MTGVTERAADSGRRRWIVLSAVAVTVALAGATAGVVLAPSGPASLPSLVGAASPTPATDASGPLIVMADLLESAPADATRGQYYYTYIEQWSRADDQIVGFLNETWRTDDGSITTSEKRIRGQSARSFDTAQIGVRRLFDPVKSTRSSLGADEVESFIERHGPPSGNPVALAQAIDSDNGGQPATAGCPPACDITVQPIVLLDAITGLYRETYLDRAARAALLRLVAVQPGVALLGEVTDRSGRKAIGAAVTEGGVRFSLLFDRKTGVLLASERAVPGFVLDDYSLYLALDRRDGLTPANGGHV